MKTHTNTIILGSVLLTLCASFGSAQRQPAPDPQEPAGTYQIAVGGVDIDTLTQSGERRLDKLETVWRVATRTGEVSYLHITKEVGKEPKGQWQSLGK